MDGKKLIDSYIKQRFDMSPKKFTPLEKEKISGSLSFSFYVLAEAFRPVKECLKKEFKKIFRLK